MSALLAILLAASVADIASFTDADYRRGRSIELSGCVQARHVDTFILADGTGNTLIRARPGSAVPAVGDVISAHCYGMLIDDFMCQLFSYDFKVTGRAAPAAPLAVSVTEITQGKCDYKHVRVRATVANVLSDDIDARNVFLLLSDGTNTAVAAYRSGDAERLIGACVEIKGLVAPSIGQWRRFQGRGITSFDIPEGDYLTVVGPPPADPFDVPEYSDLANVMPQDLAVLGRRTVTGRVAAVWHGDRFMIETKFRRRKYMQVVLMNDVDPPSCGDVVRVIGLPRTDLFSITLVQALWRRAEGVPPPAPAEERPRAMTARQLLTDANGNNQIQPLYHGSLVRLSGTVRSLPTEDWYDNRVQLQSGDFVIPVDASACPEAFRGVTPDCEVEVTGVCLLQAESWQLDTPVPSVRGFALVIRRPADVRVLARPPWWSPSRLLIALGVLVAAVVFFVIWNRILGRVVVRRSRELAREQIARDASDLKVAERTRLAVELHDSLSQNLEGVACQVSATKGVLADDPATAAQCLAAAEQMLASCRTELRSCLFDLRGDALQSHTFGEALRKTLRPLATRCSLAVRFEVRTAGFGDSCVHAVLSIVRELASNAIRHGHAARVRIAGARDGNRLLVSVRDDGCGFDPSNCPNAATGHFGLEGVRTRVERLDGTLRLESEPGKGTAAYVTITIPT